MMQSHNSTYLSQLQSWLDAQPEIGGTYSVLDYISMLERTLMPEDVDDDPVPRDPELTRHLVLLGAESELRRFAESDFSTT